MGDQLRLRLVVATARVHGAAWECQRSDAGWMNVLAKILERDREEMGPKEQPEVGFVGLVTDNRIGRLRLDPDPVQVFANRRFRCGCGVHGGKC